MPHRQANGELSKSSSRVDLLKADGISHIWLPAPMIRNTPYQNTISARFTAEGGTATLSKDKQSALGILSARYAGNAKPSLSLTSRVALRNYTVDLSSRAMAPSASRAELDYFLQPSRYVPTDGIVKQTALKATAGATTDMQKARAIYDWVVENTFRDPKVRGCGRGDIRFMLESGDAMGGKSCRPERALLMSEACTLDRLCRPAMSMDCGSRSLTGATRTPRTGHRYGGEEDSTAAWKSTLRGHGWVPMDHGRYPQSNPGESHPEIVH